MNARRAGRIVCFTASKAGAGISSVCLNLALAWAGSQPRKVLIVHLDPLCREDVSTLLGLRACTVAEAKDLLERDRQRLRSRLRMSRWGVGVVTLATTRADAAALEPGEVASVLERLSADYDLFIDGDPCAPALPAVLERADVVFWLTLPRRAHVEATAQLLGELGGGGLAADRLELVVNQSGVAGGLDGPEMDRFSGGLPKAALSLLPFDHALPVLADLGRIPVVERPQSPWVGALRPLLGRVMGLHAGA